VDGHRHLLALGLVVLLAACDADETVTQLEEMVESIRFQP
jgi:hypothetical protein